MSPGLRNVLVTVALVFLAAWAGAWICTQFADRQGERRSLHEMVHKDLSLTTEQDRRLDAIERAYAPKRRALEAEIVAANRELAVAIQASHQDSPAVQAAIDRVHGAMGALQKATIGHVFAMRAVLSKEQAVKFDAEVAEALTDGDR